MDPKLISDVHAKRFWLHFVMDAHVEQRGDRLHVFVTSTASPSLVHVVCCAKNGVFPQMLGEPRIVGDPRSLNDAETMIRAEMARIDLDAAGASIRAIGT